MKNTFTITITDNETGEVVLDHDDVVALIGGITRHSDEGVDSASVRFIHANLPLLAMTLDSAVKSVEEVKKRSPLAGLLCNIGSKYSDAFSELLDNQEEK